MKKFLNNTIVQLLIAVTIGIVSGFYVDGTVLSAIVSIKHVSGQVIFFLVPLIILGFIAPSIAHLRSNASKMLLFAFGIAYLSSIGASFFGAAVGYQVIPHLDIASDANALKALPENMLKIDIPPVMNVMTAFTPTSAYGTFGRSDRIRSRRGIIGCGNGFSVALKETGVLCYAGDNRWGQKEALAWQDILAVYCGPDYVLGLSRNGAVLSAGISSEANAEPETARTARLRSRAKVDFMIHPFYRSNG